MFDVWRSLALACLCGVLLTWFQGPAVAEAWEDEATPSGYLYQIHDEVTPYPFGWVRVARTIYSPTSEYILELNDRLHPKTEESSGSAAFTAAFQKELIKRLTDRSGHDAWTTARFAGRGETLRLTRWYRDGECGFLSAEPDGIHRRYHFALHHYLKDDLVGNASYPLREGPWSDRHVEEVQALDKMRAQGIEMTLSVHLPGTVDLKWGETVSQRGPVDLDLLEPWADEALDRENSTFVSSTDLDYFNVGFLFAYFLMFWFAAGWLRRFRAARG